MLRLVRTVSIPLCLMLASACGSGIGTAALGSSDPATPAPTAGLRVEVSANDTVAGRETPIRVHISDDDGESQSGDLTFGDGEDMPFVMGAMGCASLSPEQAGQPQATEETPTITHSWKQPGTYTLRLTISTEGNCGHEAPKETATATATINVTSG